MTIAARKEIENIALRPKQSFLKRLFAYDLDTVTQWQNGKLADFIVGRGIFDVNGQKCVHLRFMFRSQPIDVVPLSLIEKNSDWCESGRETIEKWAEAKRMDILNRYGQQSRKTEGTQK